MLNGVFVFPCVDANRIAVPAVRQNMRTIPLIQSVGRNCTNRPADVKAVHEALVSIGKIARGSWSATAAYISRSAEHAREERLHLDANPRALIQPTCRSHPQQ